MSIETNFLKYHASISEEIKVMQDRVRQLIGNRHWLSDGEHKESVLRSVIRSHLPDSLVVGKGFVCFEHETSNQIDIMLISNNKPILFRDGEFFIITPELVEAIIEVKTSQSRTELRKTIQKLSYNVQQTRENGNANCLAGLFIYNDNSYDDRYVLEELAEAAASNIYASINWLALGSKRFFRFWEAGWGSNCYESQAAWHSYELNDPLAYSYFISNVVWDATHHSDERMNYAWFPIPGGKEGFKKWYVPLTERSAIQF